MYITAILSPTSSHYAIYKSLKVKVIPMTCLCRHTGQPNIQLQLTRNPAVEGHGWPLFTRERPGTKCTGGWVGLGTGLDGTENLAPIGIRYPDRPARSESLYRLRYPGPLQVTYFAEIAHNIIPITTKIQLNYI